MIKLKYQYLNQNFIFYRWRRCDGEIVSTNGSYSVESVDPSSAGCYSCEADNGFSITPVTSEVTVIVQCE